MARLRTSSNSRVLAGSQGRDATFDLAAGARPPPGRYESARCTLQPDLFSERPPSDAPTLSRSSSLGAIRGAQRKVDVPHLDLDKMPRFGNPSCRGESVGDVLQASKQLGTIGLISDRNEMVYESSRREPLGKAYARGYEMPTATRDPGFRFGVPSSGPHDMSKQTGKDVIAPVAAWREDPEVHKWYVRSHWDFAPGEQVDRRYAWPDKIARNPGFRFGRPDSASKDGAAIRAALADDGDAKVQAQEVQQQRSADKENQVVPKNGEVIRRNCYDPVGSRARACSQGGLPVPAGFAFGAPRKGDGVTAGDLIRGSYTTEEQLPDRDLGRCLREGRRNVTSTTCAFGRPSRPASRPGSPRSSLLQPPPRVDASESVMEALAPDVADVKDLRSGELSKPRSLAEVRSLMEAAGYQLPEAELQDLWRTAARRSVDSSGASLDAVIQAYSERQSAVRVPQRRTVTTSLW